MPVSNLPHAMIWALHLLRLRKMTATELILLNGNHVRHYFDPKPGEIIYHYAGVGAIEGILRTQQFWLSEFDKTNDVSEFVFAKNRFAETIPQLEPQYGERATSEYLARLAAFEDRMSMLIGSFTQNGDDLTQWDRYADHAAGCVLGIDAHWLWKHPGIRLHQVIYEPDYLKSLVEANLYILRDVEKRFKQKAELMLPMLASQLVFEQFCFKDPRFISEGEIRVSRGVLRDPNAEFGLTDQNPIPIEKVISGPFAQTFPIRSRNGVFGVTKYIEIPLSDQNGSALRTIGFGPRCTAEDEQKVRAACTNLSQISFWRSDLPLR